MLSRRGLKGDALEVWEQVASGREKVLGFKDQKTIVAEEELFETQAAEDKWEEAEELWEQAVDART